jgi:peptide-methionine (S)-S-oxide reductase
MPTTQAADSGKREVAIVAGGCFWCIDGVFRQLKGVTDVVSGYAGGPKELANYEAVCTGTTGHAESVKITYDPAQISFGEILQVFFGVIDPTTLNQQGNDVGPQYRSAVFYLNDEQKALAEDYVRKLEAAKVFPSPIVTQVVPLREDQFYPAEAYHQNYVACHRYDSGYVRFHAVPMVEHARDTFKDKVKPEEEVGK